MTKPPDEEWAWWKAEGAPDDSDLYPHRSTGVFFPIFWIAIIWAVVIATVIVIIAS